MLDFFSNLDGNILLWIQEFVRNDLLTPIFIFITKLGDAGAIWIILSVVLLFFKKTRKAGFLSLLALLGAYLIDNVLLKNIIARTRPYEVVDGLKILIEKQVDFSFPSGHTGSSFASAIILYKELPKKYGVPLVIFAILMGLSRLYVGVHYPSDVICGAIIGILIAIIIRKLYYYFNKNDLEIVN